jgi:hypothetical protein
MYACTLLLVECTAKDTAREVKSTAFAEEQGTYQLLAVVWAHLVDEGVVGAHGTT